MRTIVAWTMALAVGAWSSGSVHAQKPANAPAPRRPPASAVDKAAQTAENPEVTKARQAADLQTLAEMNTLLDLWEKQSKKTVSLNVSFDKVVRDEGFGEEYFRGRAMLQSPDLACLEFTKCKLDAEGKPLTLPDKSGKPVVQMNPEPDERIVCTGNEVLQYFWGDRKIFVFPLDKQARQKSLQQGPLPFLFNMKAAEAKRRYSMRLLKQDANEYLIGIVPNEAIDRESFTKAFLWLNKTTFLPNKLWLLPENNAKSRVEYTFTGSNNTIVTNVAMDKTIFSFAKIAGWKVIVNPGQDGQAAQGNPPGTAVGPGGTPSARRPVPQPAMRPSNQPR